MSCMKKWNPKFYIHHPLRRLKKKKSLTKKKKSLTKKKYQKDLVKYNIKIIAIVFLLGIFFVALFKYVF